MFIIILYIASFLLVSSLCISSLPITGTFTPVNTSGDVTISAPFPSNESWVEISDSSMNITVSNNLGEEMNVSFYWGSNDSLIDTDIGVLNNSIASVTVGFDYVHYQQYWWYVTVNSSSYNQKSGTWWFKGEAYDWDIDRDQHVNNTDRQSINMTYLDTDSLGREDINEDGIVNYLDAGALALHYGDDYP